MPFSSINRVKATIVVDNHVQDGLVAEHGFALWIETQGKHILFDTGQGNALLSNCQALGIDLSKTEALVLSHGHYDHTGGVAQVLQLAPKAHVFAHPFICKERYSVHSDAAHSVSMPAASREALENLSREQLHWVTQPVDLFPGIGLTGPVPRTTEYEDGSGVFYLDPNGVQPDLLEDDLSLWISSTKGILLFVGCSHAGIMNIISLVLRMTGQDHVHAILGGLHLLNAGEQRLQRTLAQLAAASDYLYPCHCTGDAVVQKMQQAFPYQIRTVQAGLELNL
jgi:7,8-dihydropterin-6-yl-methyl-4-(beta-D-ribofuranosyl)aminobenzene 5'-phosphate synthase